MKNKKITLYPYLKLGLNTQKIERPSADIPNVLESGRLYSFLNGRSALETGLRCLSSDELNEVLVPAYQCPVVLHAIVRAGMKPIFYRLNNDCTVNVSELEKKITKRTQAIIVVHYFGFPTPIKKIAEFCHDQKLFLIEDCAHSFFGDNEGKPVGGYGDLSIASLPKFFPVYLGGYLVIRNRKILLKMNKFKYEKSSLFFQIKSVINTLEMGCDSDESLFIRKHLFKLKDRIWPFFRPNEETRNYNTNQNSSDENPYAPELIDKTYSKQRIPLGLKGIYAISHYKTIIDRRRENYQYVLDRINMKDGWVPLKSELPLNTVPYNFPVIIPNADNVCRKLRKKQIKIARFAEYLWEGIDRKTFPTASYYASNCIQIPIHQSLTKKDLSYVLGML